MNNVINNDLKHDWISKDIDYKRCPRCHHHDLDTRIPRSFFVKTVLFWMPFKRYKCSNCNAKVHVLVKKD